MFCCQISSVGFFKIKFLHLTWKSSLEFFAGSKKLKKNTRGKIMIKPKQTNKTIKKTKNNEQTNKFHMKSSTSECHDIGIITIHWFWPNLNSISMWMDVFYFDIFMNKDLYTSNCIILWLKNQTSISKWSIV